MFTLWFLQKLQIMTRILLFLALALSATVLPAQINEGFEGEEFPPAGWATFWETTDTITSADSEWDVMDLYANTGSQCAYSDYDDSETWNWLVTPQYTPTAENHVLYFYQRQYDEDEDYFSEYYIKVTAGDQADLESYELVSEHDESTFDETFTLDSVDLSDYLGTPIYIAFVHYQEDGDNWYIDDVHTTTGTPPNPVTYVTPTNGSTVEIVNTQSTIIDFSWENDVNGSTPQFYDFYVGTDADSLPKFGTPTNPEVHPNTFHYNTTYFWKVVAGNTFGISEGSETWSFTTSEQPVVVAPYYEDFENGGYVPDGMDQLITNSEFWQFDTTAIHFADNGVSPNTSESGNYFAYIDDSEPNGPSTALLTPFIDISSLETPTLSFYLNSNKEDDSLNVKLEVYVRDETAGWSSFFTHQENTDGWEKVTLSIPTEMVGPIQVKFIGNEEDFHIWDDDLAIDDIKVANMDPDGTMEVELINGLSYFPNPVKDHLAIQAKEPMEVVRIYDMLGQNVLTQYVRAATTLLDVSSLKNGAYTVKVTAGSKHSSFKVIVNR